MEIRHGLQQPPLPLTLNVSDLPCPSYGGYSKLTLSHILRWLPKGLVRDLNFRESFVWKGMDGKIWSWRFEQANVLLQNLFTIFISPTSHPFPRNTLLLLFQFPSQCSNQIYLHSGSFNIYFVTFGSFTYHTIPTSSSSWPPYLCGTHVLHPLNNCDQSALRPLHILLIVLKVWYKGWTSIPVVA